MKTLTVIFMLVVLGSISSCMPKSSDQKDQAVLDSRLSQEFKFDPCVSVGESVWRCENSEVYCYKQKGYKKGGLSCFKK